MKTQMTHGLWFTLAVMLNLMVCFTAGLIARDPALTDQARAKWIVYIVAWLALSFGSALYADSKGWGRRR